MPRFQFAQVGAPLPHARAHGDLFRFPFALVRVLMLLPLLMLPPPPANANDLLRLYLRRCAMRSRSLRRIRRRQTRGLNDRQRSRLRNEKIGFVFQSFNLIPDLNVFDNIDVPLRYRGMPGAERKRRIHAVLERVGLTSRMRHYPSEMSGGQQQRVAIARALVGEPRLLLADEPTGNLDTHMARGVMELLEELHRGGATIVMVTHDPDLAARAQRQVHIIDGTIVELTADPRLVREAEGETAAAGSSDVGAAKERLRGGRVRLLLQSCAGAEAARTIRRVTAMSDCVALMGRSPS